MGLGEALRKAMDKIGNAGAIDKDTVKEAVKEMQRALIAANVDVTTVLSLSKNRRKSVQRTPKRSNTKRIHNQSNLRFTSRNTWWKNRARTPKKNFVMRIVRIRKNHSSRKTSTLL